MKIPHCLDAEILSICRRLKPEELTRLPFRKPLVKDVPNAWLAEQAVLQHLAFAKLPGWAALENLVYPDRQALEQCTSSLVADWKKTLLPDGMEVFADASAGLGVDAFTLGESAKRLVLFESDAQRARALRYNSASLHAGNAEVNEKTLSEQELSKLASAGSRFLLYADPDRRSEEGKRKFHWTDCSPDVRVFYGILKDRVCRMMVKFSPLDDPEEILEILPGASGVYILSVHNEVKEVLMLWDFSSFGNTSFYAVDLRRSGEVQKIRIPTEFPGRPGKGELSAGQYLLDPLAALRKGRFASCLAEQNGWKQLSSSARLYMSETKPVDFPGRVFRMVAEYDSPSAFRKRYASRSCHVVTRDYPVSAGDLLKGLKLQEEGDDYLFCFGEETGRRRVVHVQRC